MKSAHKIHVGQRIRTIRRQMGWTLEDCQRRSSGKLPAVTLGAYERGERSISLAKLSLIAELLQVPIEYLLSGAEKPSVKVKGRHVYDLHALSLMPSSAEKELLMGYLTQIIHERGDWRGAVITLRAADISNLHILFYAQSSDSESDYLAWVEKKNFRVRLESNARFN